MNGFWLVWLILLTNKTMIAIISIFLFILWLMGTLGAYTVGWSFHILLGASILLMFIAAVHNKKPEVTDMNDVMSAEDMLLTETEQVREIMNKNSLNEQEAIKLLNYRLRFHHQ